LTAATSSNPEINGLRIIPLRHIAQAIFLVGTKEEIRKAEEIIDEVESQVGGVREKIIWWYTTKHSDPEDLAQILEKIYYLMISRGVGMEERPPGFPGGRGGPRLPPGVPPFKPGDQQNQAAVANTSINVPTPLPREYVFSPFAPSRLYQNDFYQQGGYVVNPTPVEPRPLTPPVANQGRNNFIVDLKTGAIVMVVEADILPKIKELIKKLDVPKKMVQIEALLFEKRLSRSDNFGLNLLRIGSLASNINAASILWNNIIAPTAQVPNPPNNTGILDFLLSQKGSHGIPAYDIFYRFLISQEDIQINANPTVVTVNQTPAKIAIVDEISVNTGTLLFNTNGNTVPEAAFTRAQYGITIVVTPTIHMSDDKCSPFDDMTPYVTLDTDITFDSIGGTNPQQPDVVRRHITNQVSIPDGQTVVIGGLRRKDTDDVKNSIPYLGEIPGFGKLFSTTTMQESNVDLIMFLTPKIISDFKDDFEILRTEEMLKRPGDIPEFLCILREALDMESNRLYAGTMNVLFGRPLDRCVPESVPLPSSGYPCDEPTGEYDGR
jgi:general secretion pathway protein D